MKNCSRRDFLKHSACTGLAATAGGLLHGCGPVYNHPVPQPPKTHVDRDAKVSAVRGTSLPDMVRESLEPFGGMPSIVSEGDAVFLKPNLTGAGMVNHPLFTTGECTKPEVILTVAEECLKAGAQRVIVGDAAQARVYSWEEMFTLDDSTNMYEAVLRLNEQYPGKVQLACLSAHSPSWKVVASPYSGLDTLKISSYVMNADKIISLPVLKTHRWTQVTLSLKNFMGVVSCEEYGIPGMTYRVQIHNSPGGLNQTFLDIVDAVKPDFTIVDCSIGAEGNGPHVMEDYWATPVDLRDRLGDWLIMAGPDLVATDATASRMIGMEPETVSHLRMAYDRGMGQMLENRIEIVGPSLDDLKIDWKKPDIVTGSFEQVALEGFMLLFEQPS